MDQQLQKEQGRQLKFSTQVTCSSTALPHLIGRQGTAKLRFERETGTRLTFPRRRYTNTDTQEQVVMVTADTREALDAAVQALRGTVDKIASKEASALPSYNAFVSVPLGPGSAALRQAVRDFQSRALAAYQGTPPIPPEVFSRPETVHLTVVMLRLYNDQEKLRAAEVLQGVVRSQAWQNVLGGQALTVQLKGLGIMKGNATAATVLYAHVVDVDGQMAKLFDIIVQAFVDARLVVPKEVKPPLLHATLMNTRHIMPVPYSNGKRLTLNVADILVACRDMDFGQHQVPHLHVSLRHQYDRETGYYEAAAIVELT